MANKNGNPENLIPEAHKLTDEDRAKGQEVLKQKRAEERLLKDEIIKAMDAKDWSEVIDGVLKRAKESDKGFEVLRDTIGQKPTDKSVVDIQSKGIEDILRDYGKQRRRY